MTIEEKRLLRERFLARLGPGSKTFLALLDCAPEMCTYLKDVHGRIMAINRRNREVCNIKGEWDAIGHTSHDLFPQVLAESYAALDREVLATGQPVLNRITEYPADRSPRFMISNVYPLHDCRGRIIGTARAYHLTSTDGEGHGRFGRLRVVENYITEHFAEEIPLVKLAALAGMSLTVFKREFSAAFSMSPGRYIQKQRLNAACRLLESSSSLLSEIAVKTGFYDESHFVRTFKAHRGITPGEYRRRHQAHD